MNLLFRVYELNYIVARFTGNPRQAADSALYPFSLLFISPIVGTSILFEVKMLPFESHNANVFFLAPFAALIIFLTHVFIVKKHDFKKRARDRDGITSKYSLLIKILSSLLIILIAMSGIWLPITSHILTENLIK